jgi:hypothetical protein
MRWPAFALLVLVGCSQQEPPPRRYEPASSYRPSSQSFRFAEGTLTVLEVPLQEGRRVEFQRCFLWRSDRSESLHCQDDTDAAPMRLPDDPPGPAERY